MAKMIIMFPGVGYTMDFPLMYYASFLYEAKGYEQIHMKYNSILFEPDLTREEKTLKARDYVWEKVKDIDFSVYDEVVFLSKRFGTAEAGILAERLGIQPMYVEGADHSLEVKGKPFESLEILKDVMRYIER